MLSAQPTQASDPPYLATLPNLSSHLGPTPTNGNSSHIFKVGSPTHIPTTSIPPNHMIHPSHTQVHSSSSLSVFTSSHCSPSNVPIDANLGKTHTPLASIPTQSLHNTMAPSLKHMQSSQGIQSCKVSGDRMESTTATEELVMVPLTSNVGQSFPLTGPRTPRKFTIPRPRLIGQKRKLPTSLSSTQSKKTQLNNPIT
ncbi:UNVERIFIED_CONTAM: hypothetical protein Sindi_2344600 [Sesamum indicum]